jgi:hypothetical protein
MFLSERLYFGLVAPNAHPNRHPGGCRFTHSRFRAHKRVTVALHSHVRLLEHSPRPAALPDNGVPHYFSIISPANASSLDDRTSFPTTL